MHVNYLVQPDVQLGQILLDRLSSNLLPKRVVLVSAFVRLQTVLRFKSFMRRVVAEGGNVRFVVGIDMGGTSREVLEELLSWEIDTYIVKNAIPGHTFHPKIYLLEWEDRAEIIVGSSNATEGGFFKNYEGNVLVVYHLPTDVDRYHAARVELARFLEPTGPTSRVLTAEYLADLTSAGVLPAERDARPNRARVRGVEGAFGAEEIQPPPPLPREMLDALISSVRERRRTDARGARDAQVVQSPIPQEALSEVSPAAFYMTLPKLQGDNIPGEARVPLEAVELAQEFWGWPDEYARDESPRAGQDRVYWNWRPIWRVWSTDSPADVVVREVRMYMYANSSDFRFYSRPLVEAGADLGDVVRIRRIAQEDAEYECVLAKEGTEEHARWLSYCTQPVRNSTRRFGYA